MGEIWIPEAENLKAAGTSGVMEGGAPRATWHVTVSPSGKSAGGTDYFDVMHRVLTAAKAEPHILYDPVTDRLGQYFPLNTSSRALKNDGARRTNGAGTVNIQIEVVANTAPVFTSYWKPGPNYLALMRAIRSWGVPDEWPAGRLATSYGDNVDRSWASYLKPGHFAHCNVPGNDHWDTGPIDQQAIFAAAKEDDMFEQKDRDLLAYISKQVKATAQLVVDGDTRLSTAVAAGIKAAGSTADVDALAKAIVVEFTKGA